MSKREPPTQPGKPAGCGAPHGLCLTPLRSPRSTVPSYSSSGTATPTQGVNMANSIASLRLKAKEFSLHQNQVPTVN